KGDNTDLGNWRPLTMLCVDYKLLARVLANRMGTVLPHLVHVDQTSGVAGRSLSQYADDTPLLLDRDACLVRALEIFQNFGPMKLLGVSFETVNSATINWTPRLSAVQKKLFLWKSRCLTFIGKARGLMVWSNLAPRVEQQPWHYHHATKWLRVHPEASDAAVRTNHKVLYCAVKQGAVAPAVVGTPARIWRGIQPRGLENGLKDLNWLCLHKCLPVRDTMYRHGLARFPGWPRATCAGEETVRHVMWDCPVARVVWAKARAAEERLTARTGFCRSVIMGLLGLTVENVRCIQWNQQEKAFDVTLMDLNVFNRVAETCVKEAGPPFCRRCRRVGHRESDCAGGRCRRCGEGGHEAKDCLIPKACNGC
ncbi:hypothetical protein NHX12_006927, partial [Muraenolepis orangiensis]